MLYLCPKRVFVVETKTFNTNSSTVLLTLHLISIFFLFTFIYLKGRERHQETERYIPYTLQLRVMTTGNGLGLAQTRRLEVHQSHSSECRVLHIWAILCFFARHIGRKLNWKREAGIHVVFAGGGITHWATIPAPNGFIVISVQNLTSSQATTFSFSASLYENFWTKATKLE